jgi:hypothetical protein
MPRVFVSFDYDHDLRLKNLFCGQIAKRSPTPFAAADWSSKYELTQAEWERVIAAKIAACHVMIVLIGRSTRSARGVAKEDRVRKTGQRPSIRCLHRRS